jgi:hypothetical protein
MHFAGIATTLLWQAGALLGAVVVVFYILKLRRRPVAVPFAPLWMRVLRDKEATTLLSQLKRLLSLLLQLALLALMMLALGDPRPGPGASEARHLVVLIDASASMKAVDVPQGPPAGQEAAQGGTRLRTRLDEAKDKVRELVRGLGPSDRAMIAQLDAAVTPLSTMTGDVAELDATLARVRAVDVRASLAGGLRFATDSLRGLSRPEIVLVSDGAVGEAVDGRGAVDLGAATLSFVRVGSRDRNLGITGFAVRRYPLDKSRYEVLLEATNTSAQPEDVALELYGDEQLTDVVKLRLAPGESTSRFYANLSGANRTLEARLGLAGGGHDDLPADDRAWALLPERRRARVQAVTRGNMYLEAALLLDEYLEVVTVAPDAYPAPGAFDVTIFDAVAPPLKPGSGSVLYLAPPRDEHTPFKLGKAIVSGADYAVGFDEVDTKHPLARYLSLGEVNIARARVLEGGDGDQAVGKSFRGTLLLAGRRASGKFVALGFDVRESDLPLRIAWPLLLLSTIQLFIEEDAGYLSSFKTGEVWSIPASPAAKTARLTTPGGGVEVVPIKDGRAVFLGEQAGLYELAVVGEGGAVTAETRFAANLADPEESRIAPVAEITVAGRKAGAPTGLTVGVRRELWIYLLLAVLMVTAVEWLTYHRRVTV